jgi:hypothetical protein
MLFLYINTMHCAEPLWPRIMDDTDMVTQKQLSPSLCWYFGSNPTLDPVFETALLDHGPGAEEFVEEGPPWWELDIFGETIAISNLPHQTVLRVSSSDNGPFFLVSSCPIERHLKGDRIVDPRSFLEIISHTFALETVDDIARVICQACCKKEEDLLQTSRRLDLISEKDGLKFVEIDNIGRQYRRMLDFEKISTIYHLVVELPNNFNSILSLKIKMRLLSIIAKRLPCYLCLVFYRTLPKELISSILGVKTPEETFSHPAFYNEKETFDNATALNFTDIVSGVFGKTNPHTIEHIEYLHSITEDL